MSNTLPIAISTINSVWKKKDPYDYYAACWVTLRLKVRLVSLTTMMALLARPVITAITPDGPKTTPISHVSHA